MYNTGPSVVIVFLHMHHCAKPLSFITLRLFIHHFFCLMEPFNDNLLKKLLIELFAIHKPHMASQKHGWRNDGALYQSLRAHFYAWTLLKSLHGSATLIEVRCGHSVVTVCKPEHLPLPIVSIFFKILIHVSWIFIMFL